jgi:outer membrane protein OmpA-like peptidoglycan-associated protein
MRTILILILTLFLLTGCEFLSGINTSHFPEQQQRGVIDGVKLGQRSLKELQQYGIILADSTDGTHIIIPTDKLFRETIDRVTINPDFQPVLNQLVYVLQGYTKINLQVVGHTDGVMTDDLEEQKSSEYAYVLTNYLTSAGISPLRITSVRGVGSSQPIDRNNNVMARSINRRVEIITDAPIK